MTYTDEQYDLGKLDYEFFRSHHPNKPDGSEMPLWEDLSDYDKISWIAYFDNTTVEE